MLWLKKFQNEKGVLEIIILEFLYVYIHMSFRLILFRFIICKYVLWMWKYINLDMSDSYMVRFI